jgi:hypothetical protein
MSILSPNRATPKEGLEVVEKSARAGEKYYITDHSDRLWISASVILTHSDLYVTTLYDGFTLKLPLATMSATAPDFSVYGWPVFGIEIYLAFKEWHEKIRGLLVVATGYCELKVHTDNFYAQYSAWGVSHRNDYELQFDSSIEQDTTKIAEALRNLRSCDVFKRDYGLLAPSFRAVAAEW